MKKKIAMSFVVLPTFAVATLLGMKSHQASDPNVSDIILSANIEALCKDKDDKKNCDYRIMPCRSSTGNECGFSSQTHLQTCCYISYCK